MLPYFFRKLVIIMFDIVFSLLKELFDWLPMIILFSIVLGIVGSLVFKK